MKIREYNQYDYFELVKIYKKSKKEINDLKCKNYDLEKRINKVIELLELAKESGLISIKTILEALKGSETNL